MGERDASSGEQVTNCSGLPHVVTTFQASCGVVEKTGLAVSRLAMYAEVLGRVRPRTEPINIRRNAD